MVVRKNVLEYIIALVVVKNKVRFKKVFKKISNMTKFYCPKTGRNFGINLKEVIDRFIWTIELCHI
jgi:hypothetical protein